MIRGVIKVEDGAIAHYEKIIDLRDKVDPVTQEHRRAFVGYLTEFERRGGKK